MKSSGQLNEIEQTSNQTGVPLDPFAVDFFGGRSVPSNEIDHQAEKSFEGKRRSKSHKKSDWYKTLPRLTNTEAEFSLSMQRLPADLTETALSIIAESLAKFTFRQPETVNCTVLTITEVNLAAALDNVAQKPQIFMALDNRNGHQTALVSMNSDFASAIIDFILGGQGMETGNLRNLSPIETTVLEFLAVNILDEINRFVGEPLLCLQSAGPEPKKPFKPYERGAEVVFEINIGEIKGVFTILAPLGFVKDFGNARSSVFTDHPERKKIRKLEKIIGGLDLRIQLGTTFLDANSLVYLEANDIVLVEQPQIDWRTGVFSQNLRLHVGRGRNYQLRGTIENNELNGEFDFRIGEVLSEEVRPKFTPAKFKMDEKENDLVEKEHLDTEAAVDEQTEDIGENDISASLENVQVALRIEIAGNKLSLRELTALHPGQIIGLGCRPTDPVRLVTDNNDEPVATGELIEIEGQLGVRLIKVFI